MSTLTKTGVSAFLQISSFLAGISFTCLLLLFQQSGLFQNSHTIFGNYTFTDMKMLSSTLTFSVILFITSSILFCIDLALFDEPLFSKMSSKILSLFLLGFLTFLASVFIILSIIDVTILLLGLTLLTSVTIWWSAEYLKNTKRI